MKDNLKILDQNVVNLLKLCMKKGEVFIVTNSSSGWAEYSAEKYLPKTSKILNKIPIISAKRLYSKSYPGSPTEWKIKAMIHVVDNYHINKKLIIEILFEIFFDLYIEAKKLNKNAQIDMYEELINELLLVKYIPGLQNNKIILSLSKSYTDLDATLNKNGEEKPKKRKKDKKLVEHSLCYMIDKISIIQERIKDFVDPSSIKNQKILEISTLKN